MHVSNVFRPVAIFHEFSFRVHSRCFEKLRMHSPLVKINLAVKGLIIYLSNIFIEGQLGAASLRKTNLRKSIK